MFRYLNAWQIGKVKNEMRAKIAEQTGAAGGRAVFVEELMHEVPAGDRPTSDDLDGPAVDVHQEFRSRFATVRPGAQLPGPPAHPHPPGQRHRVPDGRVRRRPARSVRSSLVPAIAGALLVAFELLLIYKLWLSTRAFDREMAQARPAAGTIPASAADDSGASGRPDAEARTPDSPVSCLTDHQLVDLRRALVGQHALQVVGVPHAPGTRR